MRYTKIRKLWAAWFILTMLMAWAGCNDHRHEYDRDDRGHYSERHERRDDDRYEDRHERDRHEGREKDYGRHGRVEW